MVLAANDVFVVVASTSTAREAAAPKARRSCCYFNADGEGAGEGGRTIKA